MNLSWFNLALYSAMGLTILIIFDLLLKLDVVTELRDNIPSFLAVSRILNNLTSPVIILNLLNLTFVNIWSILPWRVLLVRLLLILVHFTLNQHLDKVLVLAIDTLVVVFISVRSEECHLCFCSVIYSQLRLIDSIGCTNVGAASWLTRLRLFLCIWVLLWGVAWPPYLVVVVWCCSVLCVVFRLRVIGLVLSYCLVWIGVIKQTIVNHSYFLFHLSNININITLFQHKYYNWSEKGIIIIFIIWNHYILSMHHNN